MRWLIVAFLSLVFAAQAQAPALASTGPVPGTAQTFTWGSGAGKRTYIVYTPKGYRAGRRVPLVVVLHGCTATAYQMMESSLYNPVADAHDFVILYPDVDQQEASMPGFNAECWDFWFPSDLVRDGADPTAVTGMTRLVISGWDIDPQRVYLVGMSAGSYLSSDLVAEYPDLYAAVAEDAGGGFADYNCIEGATSNLTVEQSAAEALHAEGADPRVIPKLVIGGSADSVVPPYCATKSLLQGLRTDNLAIDGRQSGPIRLTPESVKQEPSAVPNGYRYSISTYLDQHGCEIGERVLVDGMKHFWSGGSADSRWAYWTDPLGPSAAELSWAFVSQYTLENSERACDPRAR